MADLNIVTCKEDQMYCAELQGTINKHCNGSLKSKASHKTGYGSNFLISYFKLNLKVVCLWIGAGQHL